MNRDVFNELTPAQQKMVEIGCAEAHQWNLAQFLSNNGAALQRLQSAGVKTMEFPDSVWDAFGEASNAVHQENMGDDIYKRVYDSYMASMASSSSWIQKSDGAYTAQRDRVLG
jgi:TRAP-type mannitol/chloroaromatic compound transport system substrate-binding protein